MSHDPAYAIGIDLGTSGPRAALFADDGRQLAHAARPVTTLTLEGGGAEQDPTEVWSAVKDAISEVTRLAGVPGDRIAAVGCCGQYSSIVPVDPAGAPTANMILWMDNRGGEHNLAIYERYPDAFVMWLDRHGVPPLGSGNDSLAHILYLKHDRPAQYEAAAAFLEPMDFVNLRLTGRAAANQCTAFMSLLCDNRQLGQIDYDSDLVGMAGVDPVKLPELLPVDAVVGTVSPEVAEETGLSSTTQVFGGLNDTQAAAFATSTFEGSHGGVSIGTTSVLLAEVDFKRTDLEHEVVSMPSALPDRYMVMAENGIGGRALDFILRDIVFAHDELGDHTDDEPFRAVDAVVEGVPPGSDGVLFLPWLRGSFSPSANPLMRGGFLNLSLDTTRAHLVRAVLEGVAYNLRWLLPAVEEFVGHEFDHLVFGGGAAASDAWAQIIADVLDRPVRQLAEPELGNCRAMALLAFCRLGTLTLDDIRALSVTGAVRQPRAENRKTYDRMSEQFVVAFDQTRPIFEALNS